MAADLSTSDTTYKILAFPVALLGAVAFIYIKRKKQHKKTRLTTLLRVLFDTRIWLHKSSLLDFQYVIAGAVLFSTMIAYLSLTTYTTGTWVYSALNNTFGEPAAHAPSIVSTTTAIAMLYLAYEFGYWLDHFLSHKIPFLWEFHKVHHSAKVLTPFTNWRVHPVDSIVFYNILAITVGPTFGIIAYFFGQEISVKSVAASSIIITAYTAIYGHLQHSHLWIPITGRAGKIFMSPAHHQIHHSTNREHFDKNFGAALCLFDWLFGTLYTPPKDKQNLEFGVGEEKYVGNIIYSVFLPLLCSIKVLSEQFRQVLRQACHRGTINLSFSQHEFTRKENKATEEVSGEGRQRSKN